jgi:uncharacterized protein (TIGR02246 family)
MEHEQRVRAGERWAVLDRVEIVDLLARVVHAGDDGDLETYATLLTDDVTWSMPGVEHAGRAAVLEGIRARHDSGQSGPRSGTRHVLTTTMVDLAPVDAGAEHGARASARSTWLLVGEGEGLGDGGAPAVVRRFGTYHDVVVRTAAGWRLAARRIAFGTG